MGISIPINLFKAFLPNRIYLSSNTTPNNSNIQVRKLYFYTLIDTPPLVSLYKISNGLFQDSIAFLYGLRYENVIKCYFYIQYSVHPLIPQWLDHCTILKQQKHGKRNVGGWLWKFYAWTVVLLWLPSLSYYYFRDKYRVSHSLTLNLP